MVVYYYKAQDVLNEAIYDVNPALYQGILQGMAKLPVRNWGDQDPWDEGLIVHYNAIEKVTNTSFGKTPKYADGDTKLHPAMAIPAWATWSYTVSENDMRTIEANPNGQKAQMLKQGIIAQQGAYVNKVDRYVANYLPTANPTTDPDYMSDWQGVFDLQAATGTVQNPEDCCAAAGTLTALGIKITGAAQAVDSLTSGFDVIKDRFSTFVDTTSFQRLTKGDGSDIYTLYINPEVLSKIENKYLSFASGEKDMTNKIGDILKANYNVVPTYAFDPSYDGAAATVAEYGMGLNVHEQFVWEPIVDYGVSPWEYFPNAKQPESGVYRIWGGQRFIAYPVANKINTTWKKAIQVFSNIPNAAS